jgi:SPP1 gp7 family putative phage head morphogenesis protein
MKQTKSVKKNKNILRGKPLKYNRAIYLSYSGNILALLERMFKYSKNKIKALFNEPFAKEFFAQDEDIASQARILTNEIAEKFELIFKKNTKQIILKMIRATDRHSKFALGESLKELSGGLTIDVKKIPKELKTILKASVTENIALITTIADDYLAKVQKAAMRAITTGDGLKTLLPTLEKYEGISKRHAKFVALDQTRKVYNTMNKSRMENVGIEEFEWLHSGGGQKPRESHIDMDGKIYRLDDLPVINLEQVRKGYAAPEHGIPSQAPGCGCTMAPVVDLNGEKDED